MFVVRRLTELVATYATLVEAVATFLLTFALVYTLGRFALKPAASYLMDIRGTERTLRRGLQQLLAVGVIVASVVAGLWVAGLGHCSTDRRSSSRR